MSTLGRAPVDPVDTPDDDTPESPTRTWRRVVGGAAGGIAAGLAGVGAADVVAGTSPRLRSPVLDVGDRVIDGVPAWVKDLAIDWFGTNDKPALLIGIAVLIAVYAAVLGVLATTGRRRTAVAGAAVFGLVGSAAALGARTGADWFSPLPSLLGALVAALGLLALAWLRTGRAEAADRNPEMSSGTVTDRRRFVVGVGALAATGALLMATGRRLQARFSAADSRAAITLPAPDSPAPAVAGAADVAEASPLFTPNDEFYRIDTALTVPQVPAETWQLDITGMVDRPLRLDYDDLLGRQIVERDITLTCVSNTVGGELIGTARWLGVRLDDLLAEAGIDPAADQVVGRSVDGYTCGFPVAALDGRDAMVAVGMNGEPLPLEHGFPARLIVPGIYGYASATKWLTEIELTTFDRFDHYWVPRGYAAQAPIKIQSRIDTPRGLDRIAPGPFAIAGVAWAQPVGVEAVEVSIDDGPWQPADLGDPVNDSTWRQWRLAWDATPGRHTVSVRAIDRNGAIQTADRSEPLPDGATGHHTVVVLVDEA